MYGTGACPVSYTHLDVYKRQLLIYVLTQVTRQIVQPKLVGDSMGLPPLLTLFLLYLGFKADGIAGMILAVPIGLLFVDVYKRQGPGAYRGLWAHWGLGI